MAVNHTLWASIKSVRNESEKTASAAKIVSAVAAPMPEKNPDLWVPLRVRCTQITPIGPSGTEARKPTNRPCKKSRSDPISHIM